MYLDDSDKKYIKKISKFVLFAQVIVGFVFIGGIVTVFSYVFSDFKQADERMAHNREEFNQSKNEFMTKFETEYEKEKSALLKKMANKN